MVVLALCALIAIVPLLLHGASCGQDSPFHLQSWFAAAAAWQGGHLYPHWVAEANYGAGEPRFVFYPPLSWALDALLGFLLPWTAVPTAFTFSVLLGSGCAFYKLARAWLRPAPALSAAVLYMLNPYMLFVAFERTAYAELLGAVWMPLLLLCAMRRRIAIVPLAVTMAALWLTNAPSAVMGCYLLAFCVLLRWFPGLRSSSAGSALRETGRAGVALVLGTGAASFYVLPAWYEQRWVEITRALSSGLRVEDSFLFGHTGDAYHDLVLHTVSVIAVVVIGVGALAAWPARRAAMSANAATAGASTATSVMLPVKTLWMTLVAILAGIALLQFRASAVIWHLAPQLRFLQFPWRWLLVAGVAAALLAGLAVQSMPRAAALLSVPPARRPRAPLLLAAALLLYAGAMTAYAGRAFWQVCDDEDNVAAQRALLTIDKADGLGGQGPGFEGTDEYATGVSDNGEIQQGLPAVRLLASPDADEGDDSVHENPDWVAPTAAKPNGTVPGSVTIEQWTPEARTFSITAPQAGYAVVRLMNYPAWLVERDGTPCGSPCVTRPVRDDGLITLPFAAGTTRYSIGYHTTPDVKMARSLSLVCLVMLCVLVLRGRRQRYA